MQDNLIKDKILLTLEHLEEITSYFIEIKSAKDFLISKQNKAYYDAVLMHLQVTGEILKKCFSDQPQIFETHSEIQWHEIIRLRDIISHHYDKLESEIVFDICKNNVPPLIIALNLIVEEIK